MALVVAGLSAFRSFQPEVGKAGAYYGNPDPNAKSPKQMEIENSRGKSMQTAPAPVGPDEQKNLSPGN